MVRFHKIVRLEAKTVVKGDTRTVYINDVNFFKEPTTNLLSVSWFQKKNMVVSFRSDQQNKDLGLVLVAHKRSGQVFMSGFEGNYGLYEMILSPVTGSRTTKTILIITKQPNCHVRFAHTPFTAIRRTVPLVKRLNRWSEVLTCYCKYCLENNQFD